MSSARSGGLCSTNGQGQFEFRLYYDVEDRVGYGDWSPQCATLRNICNTLSISTRKGLRSHVAQPCQKCGSVFFVSILAAQLKKLVLCLLCQSKSSHVNLAVFKGTLHKIFSMRSLPQRTRDDVKTWLTAVGFPEARLLLKLLKLKVHQALD